jgi:formate dehydrogenase major subunit
VPSEEKVTRRYPLLLTTGRVLSQYNVGAQTRRTPNNRWHDEDRLEIHPHDAQERGIGEGDWVGIASRAGQTVLRAQLSERMQPGVVYTTFHFPESGANVITTDSSDWATNCPEYKVTAVQVTKVMPPSGLGAGTSQAEGRPLGGPTAPPAWGLSAWQKEYAEFNREQLDLLEHARGAAVVGK